MSGWFSIKFNNKFVSSDAVGFLLNLIINLFLQILSLLLLIFYMGNLEYMANFYCD